MNGTTNLHWYKDSIIYSLNIKSFYDNDGNGSGDINGLIQKLDYLEDLGVNCLTLLPFYESPMKDDGYDIADYKKIHQEFGTIEQFRELLHQAHIRNIRIVIDLILNHTSVKHEWFQRARQAAPDSPERNYYIWSDNQHQFSDAAIFFSDTETSNWQWDNEAKAYYFHRFYNHQADLNYDNPLVQEEIKKVIDFWFEMGVDGMRLTSVAYLFKREHTNCENLPEVHQYLKKLRRYVDDKYPGKILIAETNLWPESAANFFGNGDECHINYHYPLLPRLYMSLQTENSYPIIDILEQTPVIPENCQWALFLRNHDDLTLTMVTEEERDYLYKVFAQDHGAKINEGIRRRLAPLLGNDRRKIELLNVLLFSLPGTPVIYYGDEIGMGDNIYLGDRNGIRTPMQWSDDRNAGFSTANPQKLFLPVIRDPAYRYETINVANQSKNMTSLLWWTKNIIAMRKRLSALSHGNTQFINTANSKVLAFIRSYQGESILIISNLSKFSQAAQIDLANYKGTQPTEIFSQNKFFEITDQPYSLTLSPYSYYWFLLEKNEVSEKEKPITKELVEVEAETEWENFFEHYTSKRRFTKQVLPDYMQTCRWFGGKSRSVVSVEIERFPEIKIQGNTYYFLNIDVRYTDGLPETYFLPVAFITNAEQIVQYLKNKLQSVVCYLKTPKQEGIITDAIYEDIFRNEIFYLIKNNAEINVIGGALRFESGKVLDNLKLEKEDIQSEILKAEQSNTSVIYNEQFFFKIYRKLDTDINPDLELVRFLSERTSFENAPKYGGGIQFFDANTKTFVILGLLQNKIPNQGEAWTSTLEDLARYYEKVIEKADKEKAIPKLISKNRLYFEDIPIALQKMIGSITYERVVKLAQRTAEMHIALATDSIDPDFKPEPFTQNYQRSIYSGHRKMLNEKLSALKHRLSSLPENVRGEAAQVLSLKDEMLECFNQIYSIKLEATKTRIHGDYHLGQVLFNGRDFYIIDFEGEPMLSISERRLKKTPLKDVAGMLRSYHYAAYGQLLLNQNYRKEDLPFLEQWALQWYHYVNQFFWTAYLDCCEGQSFLPQDETGKKLLLRVYMLEKAIYEVGYEMNSRPDWLRIPLKGVLYIIDDFLKQ